MTIERRGPALPQLRASLGNAAADLIANEAASERPRRTRTGRAPLRVKLLAPLAAAMALGALAVGAGAMDLIPFAPQLSPEKSGVKPDAVPGEVQILETPNGQKVQATVSPCIKSDPSGYSNAELSDPEWCFHPPHAGNAAPEVGSAPQGSIVGRSYSRGPERVWHRDGTLNVEHK